MSKSFDSTRSLVEAARHVLGGLTRQQEILESLRQLAESQGPLIDAGEHDSLLELVHRRQELVESLGQMCSGMSDEMEQVRLGMESLNGDLREEISSRVSTVQQLVNTIAAMDMDDARRLSEQQSGCRTRLDEMTSAATARNTYRPVSSSQSRFADAKG